MRISQDERYAGKDWWTWSVWIEASNDDLANVEKVIWHLHPTFKDPVRVQTNRAEKFRLNTAGWGTFRIRADVIMNDETSAKLYHELELHYPDGTITDA